MSKEDIAFRKLSMPVKAVSEVDGHGIQINATQPAFRMRGGLLPTNGMKIDCVTNKGALQAYFGQYPKCTPE